MELTTAFGGVQAAERAATEQEPSTPQEPASPSAAAAEANTTPKDQERFRDEVGRILASFGHGDGHVFNLGHGITPEVDPVHAGAFIEAVHELSTQYHV